MKATTSGEGLHQPVGSDQTGKPNHGGEGSRTQAMGVLHQVQAMGPALPQRVPQVSGGDLQTYTAGQGQRQTVPETLR